MADCELSFGSNVVGAPGSNNNSSCNCASGYQWNSSKTACQVIPAPTTNATYSPAGSGSFTSALQVGSSGDQVTLLQTLLIKLGYFSGGITGYYGSMTKAAVVTYQTSHGISPTGMVGPKTMASLNSDLSIQ
jgi:peptidoglycan hydrolase-like protein with peptidoglycan-binding domain